VGHGIAYRGDTVSAGRAGAARLGAQFA